MKRETLAQLMFAFYAGKNVWLLQSPGGNSFILPGIIIIGISFFLLN